jgi:hypothetical protein
MSRSFAIRSAILSISLRPNQLAVVVRRDCLRALDDRDVLGHAQPQTVVARLANLVEHLGELEIPPGHGSTASNSAWTTSPTASAIACPMRAIAACANRALPGVPASPRRADMATTP